MAYWWGSWWCYATAAASFFAGGSPFQLDFWYSPTFLYLFWPFQGLAGAVAWGILITFATALGTCWIWQDLGKSWAAAWCLAWAANYLCTGNVDALLALAVLWCWRHRATLGYGGGILLGLCSAYPVFPLCYVFFWANLGKAGRERVVLGAAAGILLAWAPALPWVPDLLASAFNATGMGGDLLERVLYFLPWHCPWFCYAAVQAWRLAPLRGLGHKT